MQEVKKRKQIVIPSFGNWDSCDEAQITQYFESARQAGLLRGHSFRGEEVDLYKAFPPSLLQYYHYRKPRKVVAERKQQQQHRHQVAGGRLKQQGKQARVRDVIQPQRRGRAPKAVDEDLYKIPPELLNQKPKRRVMLSDLWKRCMRLDCVP